MKDLIYKIFEMIIKIVVYLLSKPVLLSLVIGAIFTIRAFLTNGIWSAYWSVLLWSFITILVLIVTVIRQARDKKEPQINTEENLVEEIHFKRGSEMVVLKKYKNKL